MEHERKNQLINILREHNFGRIAEAIDLTWGNVECEKYMMKLIIDDRGDRQGFPSEIFDAILSLSNIHASEFTFKKDPKQFSFDRNDVWDSVHHRK